MSERIAAGDVVITQVAPGEMSPGEFSHRVCEVVNATGARVVMIDSANGYLNAIPQSGAPLVRLHELLGYLNSRGVATYHHHRAARDHRHGDGDADRLELCR